MKRTITTLLKLETALTVPTFIVVWFFSAVIFAARAGWTCAAQPTESKRAALAKLFGEEGK